MPIPTVNVIDAAKSLAELARAYKNMDLYKQAVDLMAQVTELAGENFKAQQTILQLQAKVADLEAKLKVSDEYEFRQQDNAFVKKNQPNGSIVFYYCPRCMNKDAKAVKMGYAKDTEQYICSVCGFVNTPPRLRH